MRTIVASLLIASIAVASATPMVHSIDTSSDAYYYIQGAKGLWTGYQQGFYKNTKKDIGNCLNDQVIEDVVELADFFKTFDTTKMMSLLPKGMEVFNSLNSCSVTSTFTDVATFCVLHPDSCTSASLMENVTKNLFVLMGKFTEVTTIMNGGFPAPTAADLYTQTESMGNIVGTILRLLSGFQP